MKIPTIEDVTVDGFADTMHDDIAEAVLGFSGDIRDLESAIGAYYLAHIIGFKPLYVIHSKNTVRKYIEIIPQIESVEPESDLSFVVERYVEAKSKSNFWKAVSGETKLTCTRHVDFYVSIDNRIKGIKKEMNNG